jgi:uncharacterized membrane protein YdjX (TVP38/TMEM64 family)
VVLAAGLLVAATAGLHSVLETAVVGTAAIIERHPAAGVVVFVLLAAVSAMLAFFSSAIMVPIAVYRWGAGWACVLLLGGWLLGAVVSYGVGRFLGTPLLRRFVGRDRLAFYEKRINRRLSFSTVLLVQLAAPAEISGYLLGVVRYSFPVFLLTRLVGELPYAVGAVFLGEGLLDRRYWLIAVLGAIALAFVAWSLRRLHRSLRGGDVEPSPSPVDGSADVPQLQLDACAAGLARDQV